jgi:hypothetical protein
MWAVLATALFVLAFEPGGVGARTAARLIAVVFAAVTAFVVVGGLMRKPRGLVRHPAWILFGSIAFLSWWGAG